MNSTLKCEFSVNSNNYRKIIEILRIMYEDEEKEENNLQINISQNEIDEPQNENLNDDESSENEDESGASDNDDDTLENEINQEIEVQDPNISNLNVLVEGDYYLVSQYRIKRPSPNSGRIGRERIEWFVKKVRDTPELMLNCKYCAKTYWKRSVDSIASNNFLQHQEKCKEIKKNVEYTDNIRIRS